MRFLCLHGMGTNSQVFEMQTAAIRYALGPQHTYDFIEGSIPAPMAPGIESLVSADDEFFQYADETSAESCNKALGDLEAYIQSEGPFDGIMAFSQGAGLAATLMIRKIKQEPIEQRLSPLFRCAIFFCGAVPEDPCAITGGRSRRLMKVEDDGEVIETPTAHIWGRNDRMYPHFGPVLSGLCRKSLREDLVHEGGHEMPGPKDPEHLKQTVRYIERTIERALEAQ